MELKYNNTKLKSFTIDDRTAVSSKVLLKKINI